MQKPATKSTEASPSPSPLRDRIVELRRVKASDLVPNPKNWRTHGKAQKLALQGALSDIGFAGAVVARQDDRGRLVVLDGHLRGDVAGDREIPVLVTDLNEAEGDLLLASYDPIAALAGRDDARLRTLLNDAKASDLYLKKLLEKLGASVGTREDKSPPAPPPMSSHLREVGQVWRLGAHTLRIEDCLESKLRDDFDCVITDPPYAIYGSSTGIGADIADDKMVRPFFLGAMRAIAGAARTFAHLYVFCDWRSFPLIVEMARKEAGLTLKNCLVWDKGGGGLGGMYANTYELVAFFSRMPKAKALNASKPRGERMVSKPNILRFPRPRGPDDRQHNAAKPVPLLLELLENSTDPGESVLDPFCGSGSTLMACEQLGRVCTTIELDPGNADITIRRWEKFTGLKARKA